MELEIQVSRSASVGTWEEGVSYLALGDGESYQVPLAPPQEGGSPVSMNYLSWHGRGEQVALLTRGQR